MTRLLSCFAAMGILLLSAPVTCAKARTVRITITGGILPTTLQITSGDILSMSNAWGAEFLDISKPPQPEPANRTSTYEVTFYSQIAPDRIAKTCVFYYSPQPSSQQGYIYLPGHGPLWYMNTGTTIREGRDGRWSYASPQWEALIKPSIASAEAQHSSASPAKTEWATVAEKWTKPSSGWLYILATYSGPTEPGSRVWLFDPQRSKVMGSIRTGEEADFALSPNGSRLYIASGERESGELAVIDTATGTIRHISFHHRVLYHPWYRDLPPFSNMAVAADGRLWMRQQHVVTPYKIESRLLAFDPQREAFSHTTTDPATCGDGVPVSSSAENGESYPFHPITHMLTPGAATSDCQTWSTLQSPRSTRSARLYFAYGSRAPDNMSIGSEFRVIDATAPNQFGRLQTSSPFWSAIITADNKQIYALSPSAHQLLVIDAVALEEKLSISIGNRPALAIVAP